MNLIDLVSHALTAKLLAVIAEDADEATLKLALAEFPAIVRQALEEWQKAGE